MPPSQAVLNSQVKNVQPSQVSNVQPSQGGYVQLSQLRNAQASQVRNVQPNQMSNVQPSQPSQVTQVSVWKVEYCFCFVLAQYENVSFWFCRVEWGHNNLQNQIDNFLYLSMISWEWRMKWRIGRSSQIFLRNLKKENELEYLSVKSRYYSAKMLI